MNNRAAIDGTVRGESPERSDLRRQHDARGVCDRGGQRASPAWRCPPQRGLFDRRAPLGPLEELVYAGLPQVALQLDGDAEFSVRVEQISGPPWGCRYRCRAA